MKIFKKKRLFIYIAFIVFTVIVLGFVIFSKLGKNILIGKWESEDKSRIYQFDENTLTLTFADSMESKLYGYILKDNNKLILQIGENKTVYDIVIHGEKIGIYSENSDSPEILQRVYE
ncbi:MAG: hypothetical protein E7490_10385 [Ruminococcaceae bacterium]|nr:hypothetical protein [Oscillospiraceae bacterium]